jgi:DNA topoisomerase IA
VIIIQHLTAKVFFLQMFLKKIFITLEVELISLMDRNGIGTDATIAQHISTIQDRAYATKNAQQKFVPTKLGIALVEGYNR